MKVCNSSTSIPKPSSTPLPIHCSHTKFSKKSTSPSNVNDCHLIIKQPRQVFYTLIEKEKSTLNTEKKNQLFQPMTSKKHSTSSPYFCKLFASLPSSRRTINSTSTIHQFNSTHKQQHEISSIGKLTSNQLLERMKKAFELDELNRSRISNAFQNVPHPIPVTLSNSTISKLERENVVYSIYSHPSSVVNYNFELQNPLPEHVKEFFNGSERRIGYCCHVCSMHAKSIIYSNHEKFQIYHGVEIGKEELKKIVQMYGNTYSGLLGGRICDRHYQQICLFNNSILSNVSLSNNASNTQHSSDSSIEVPRSRPIRTVSSVYATKRFASQLENIKHSPGKKTKYATDVLSSDEYALTTSSESEESENEEEFPIKRRTSTRRQQRQDLTSTFKLLIQEERQDESGQAMEETAERSDSNYQSMPSHVSNLKQTTLQSEVSNNTSIPFRKRRFFKRNSNSIASSKIYRSFDVENVSIFVVPQCNETNIEENTLNTSQVINDIDSNGSSNSNRSISNSNDIDSNCNSTLPMIQCASPEEQKRLYFMDFIEYDEEQEQQSNNLVDETMKETDDLSTNKIEPNESSASSLIGETQNLNYLVKLMEQLVNHDDEEDYTQENQRNNGRRIIKRK
ncbi:hypothetical protein NAEGRDRAFT_78128 [Naegleria gruberi]|uniref:Uncharacterized protein n=1 Tax=Naegleria gruberi TaxID=5762 RepID=D2V1D9_NAEGR|nr:uncharacterized protein NAEGRDRAFT_78128 [Naegleria gruberi]EFC49147.1 hypothetical protein NAEGRDRAFT_78128 [Naegleria gruberi]|eukprot:XP_002681891.1 hypothetical protein NAEGRDRAFT_78128 [Naegleria gruberi strain NEG-M]